MGLGDRLKDLRDKLANRTRHDGDAAAADQDDSAAAPAAHNPLNPVSASAADEDAAGFPSDLS